MKKIILLLCLQFLVFSGSAQKFEDFFEQNTLRLDYIFSGNKSVQNAYIQTLTKLKKWNGRVANLSSTPIQGNGQIRVYDIENNQLIYVLPFGSLFQEWLTLAESSDNSKAFEQVFLIPYPKNKVRVDIVFFDTNRVEHTLSQHFVDPTDILIQNHSDFTTVPYEVVHNSLVKNPIRVAIVAEGYKETEMNLFLQHAHETVKSLFQHKVFEKYKNHFEIIAVKTISKDSDVSFPSKNRWKNTSVKSHFDTFYSPRYLTTSNVFDMHRLLENIPYQHIIVLANTKDYGGGGILNSYTLTTTNSSSFAPVVVHEFGHSFGGLADEYFYPNDVFENQGTIKVEPWEKNITSLANFNSKWKKLLKSKTPIPTPISDANKYAIGVYEGLEGNGLYIPTQTCRMKQNNVPDFCQVCSNALEELILYYTSEK